MSSSTDISSHSLTDAYQHCKAMADSHYENFPVASILVPAAIRPAILAIYAFSRTADDFADEGERNQQQRIALLDDYSEKLNAIENNQPVNEPVFIALTDSIQRHQLPISLFHDLLDAFKQDVTKTRYQDATELLDYCRRSANPIGRLLLHLSNQDSTQNLKDSDAICTALQLINFLQDISQDYDENNRVYIPLNDLKHAGIDISHIHNQTCDQAMKQVFRTQLYRAHSLLVQGAPLAWRLPGRLGLEIRLTVFGGMRILMKLAKNEHSLFGRPRLSLYDKLWILAKTLTAGSCTQTLTFPPDLATGHDT